MKQMNSRGVLQLMNHVVHKQIGNIDKLVNLCLSCHWMFIRFIPSIFPLLQSLDHTQ